jgi:protein SCO1
MVIFRNRKNTIAVGAVCIFSLLIIAIAIIANRKPALEISALEGRIVSPPLSIPTFSLTDQRGQVFTNDSLQGHWTVAMIGYTYCPDVCPTTLSEMATFFKHFNAIPINIKPPGFVFLSVDPFRDTPAKLAEYLEYFSKDFIGVTGSPEDIHKLVTKLGLYYTYEDPEGKNFLNDVIHKPTMDDYAVVHSSSLLFITPRGTLVATMSPPFETKNVLALFKKLFAYYGD